MRSRKKIELIKTRRLSAGSLLLMLVLGLALTACQGGLSFLSTPTPTPIAYQTPDWFDHAELYEIFVRSYADSDGDGIGDLNGIASRLDYIESLGVDTIWLMPIYPSPSYHGYDVADFFAVNPDYGTLEDLQNLVADVHGRGMRLILDFVPSHLSNQNPLFEEAYGNPESEHTDWFVFTNDANTLYAGFANNTEMPRFNHFNPEVVDYLSEAALFWLDLDGDGDYTDGVDGFRVDNATFPPQEFFEDLRQRIKAANPEALLLGETWVTDSRSMSIFYQDQFDALFDFPLYSIVEGSQNGNGDGLLAGKGVPPVLLTSLLQEEVERYPAEAQAVRFLSNHDTNRIASEVGGDLGREKLAATLLVSLPGPVMVYYGEEIGMPGQQGSAPWWDAYRREPMDWYAAEAGPDMATWFKQENRFNAPDDGISVEEEQTDPGSLLNHWRAMLALRDSVPALQSGEIGFPKYAASGQGGWAITRGAGDEMVMAVFNFGVDELEITLEAAPVDMDSPADLVSGASYPAMTAGEPYALTLPPGTGVLLGK
jgi:glycosidase